MSASREALEAQISLTAQQAALGAEHARAHAARAGRRDREYQAKVRRLLADTHARRTEAELATHLEQMGIPAKDISFMLRGADRHGQQWRQGEAVRLLKEALANDHRVVLLVGPNRTGKSSAAARMLYRLCRRQGQSPDGYPLTWWEPGRFIRAARLGRLARYPSNDLSEWIEAPVLVLDDAGEEQHRDEVRQVLTERDDADTGRFITLVTSNTRALAEGLYGERVMARWREAGMVALYPTERMIG